MTSPIGNIRIIVRKGKARGFSSGEEYYAALEDALAVAERRMMLLPLDRAGKPIRPGDMVIGNDGPSAYEVSAVSDDGTVVLDGTFNWPADECLVVDPVKVELQALLERFWRETYGIVFPSDKDGLLGKLKGEYADAILALTSSEGGVRS